MPLLITPVTPLATPSGLTCAALYAIVNKVEFDRLLRQGSFSVGYYLNELASRPGSGVSELPVDLTRGYAFSILPEQADALESPTAFCEAYATNQLLALLPGATIETVE
ncbi:hypothetical protein KB206_10670 [Microvirga sp. STS02]|uniref:hypothetical protein n=1 Tax=Hymenobacter negativus TaxID=2795026 RepID=UPI0018DEAD63|nr:MULTISPECIES: hypothetical protein [Bacteria]MBH8569349.1 hypothetical protein [Hymenobacter negativus]MBR7209083.1 hypothetical protein [Microvirga sp. STS02]